MIRFKKTDEGILWNVNNFWGTSLYTALRYYFSQKLKTR